MFGLCLHKTQCLVVPCSLEASRKIPLLFCETFANVNRCSEKELRKIFDRIGKVQTCIVNKEKRHAFVKMVTRQDALDAKDAMEKNRNSDTQLRVSIVNRRILNNLLTLIDPMGSRIRTS
jgi:hypothetical protein